MNYEIELHEAGLTGNEAKVYNELLITGSISANNLSKRIGVDRSLTYTLLNNMVEKGLVKYIKKSGKKYFEASEPENLLNPIKEKEALISNLIPKLKSIQTSSHKAFDVSVYEGREGLRTVMKELIKQKKACGFGGTGRAYDTFYESVHWMKEMEKKKFELRLIMPKKYAGHTFTKAKFANVKYLKIKSEVTTMIFEDQISIHSVLDKPKVIVIKDKDIADSYRNHFEILWQQAKK
jgi:sugar-specific transcriptional regulator TrmB